VAQTEPAAPEGQSLPFFSIRLFPDNGGFQLALPPLDGGAIAPITIEAVTRKPIPEVAQRSFNRVGRAATLTASFLS
jgi:hypothetical protein